MLYRFKGEPRDPFSFKKTEKFQVPAPAPNKPNDAFEVTATEENQPRGVLSGQVEDVVPSSLKEFNAASATAIAPNGIDSLRFSNLNLVLVIGELSYGDTPEDKEYQKKFVTARLNEYIRGVLIPKLSRQGFKVKYLGVRDEVGEDILREPTLEIDYGETEGQGYTMYGGYGEPSVFGVVIDCTLLLVHPAIMAEQEVGMQSLKAENEESLKINILADQGAVLHNQALRYLRIQLNDLEFDLADWAPRRQLVLAFPDPLPPPSKLVLGLPPDRERPPPGIAGVPRTGIAGVPPAFPFRARSASSRSAQVLTVLSADSSSPFPTNEQ